MDIKKIALNNGLGKNIAGALRTLLDSDLKHVKITAGPLDTADTSGAHAILSGTLDLELDVGDTTVRINLEDITVQAW